MAQILSLTRAITNRSELLCLSGACDKLIIQSYQEEFENLIHGELHCISSSMENFRSPYSSESLMKLKLIRWPNNQPFPSREDLEKAMIQEGLAPFRMVDPPCTYYHGRVLSRPEVCWVLEGRLLVGMEDQEILLDIGDRIELPCGVKHWIRVISENGAAYLVASLPN